ncbi:hypothetical protein LSCM1_07571 [Leishmania martiniquensis]|uniref:Uncharacterized protein n=1 Tax=Leishmania martiniquensis TaxID=1580590 RepID=A0A836HWE0_9TRYP|nr:hypothetical protein LSCM1_07571 [Leishmania martiniquensis]
MADDVSPPQPPLGLSTAECAKSARANLATDSSTGAADHAAATSTWHRRQRLRRSSPPPPLSSFALSAAEANLRTTANRVATAPFDRGVHCDVTLASPRRRAASSKPVAPPETASNDVKAAAEEVSFRTSSAVSPLSSSPRDAQEGDTTPLFCEDISSSGNLPPPRLPWGGCEHCDRPRPTAGVHVLPWWKRILVDAAYRQRLMQLSTEGYHEELRIVRETPGLLSSEEGMEVRRVWRERCWMEDVLEKAELRPSTIKAAGLQEVHGAACRMAAHFSPFAPYHMRVKGHASQQGHAPAPMMEEVDEIVPMSQHVVFRVGSDEIASHFSTKQPRSIIDASAVESVQRVALGAMPPVQHVREQQQQEYAVKQHLSSLRRFSRSTPYELKESLARDVAAGRTDVPMQTAITDAVMDEEHRPPRGAGARNTKRQCVSQDVYTFPPPQHSTAARQRQYDDMLPTSTAPTRWQLPPRKPQMPATPLWQRSRLPAGMWAVESALAHVARAEALLHASAVRDPLAVAKKTAIIKDVAEAPTRHEGPCSATGAVASSAATATDGEQHRDSIRRQEAAMACVDGTENLYGLQYVWCAPLPPCGFIRVSPDPRVAMWPDSDEERDEGLLGTIETNGSAQGRHLHARSRRGIEEGGGPVITDVSVDVSQHRGHQAQMRRLARCVNHRTHKLRWLHSIGRHRVCYNDLALSDSNGSLADTDSASSSSSSVEHSSATGSVARNSDAATKGEKASGKTMSLAVPPTSARRSHRRHRRPSNPSRAARPVYDGALNINIYAEVVESRRRTVAATKKHSTDGASPPREACQGQPGQAGDAARATRRFLGCYRQSRLLIHFKLYCRALYEEERVRSGGPGTHVIGRAGGSAPEYTPSTEGPLAWVPVIPHPVLKLQERAPSLRKPHARRVPVASTMSGCRCWEGLYPGPCADLAAPAHQAWRQLRQSSLVRQALRDIFDELPHDREGLLNKRSFVLFVLQLLELFFPTRLPAAVHIAIAEEEWVYRGTTEHVGPQTFHEKFFAFPLIFYRDIATVAETHLVEFWTLVRVCLDAQKRVYGKAAAMSAAESVPSSSFTGRGDHALQPPSLSLLAPLTHFTADQLDTLLSYPPPPFDAAVYDRHCLLHQALRDAPEVRAAPRDHQYVVARSVVERQQKSRMQAAEGTTMRGKPAKNMSASLTAYRAHLSSADAARRADVEAAAQCEWDLRQRRLQAQEHEALLEQSDYYHARLGRVQSRAATVISGIESICSTWELHRTGVYAAPGEDENADVRPQTEEGMDELLLEYLDDVPLDVFDAQVSLRDCYLLHIGLERERRNNALSSIKLRPEPARLVPLAKGSQSAAAVSAGPVARATPCSRDVLEGEAQRHISVMTGGLGTMQRCNAGLTEAKPLVDGTSATPPTKTEAAVIYATQGGPRTLSMIRCPSHARRRAEKRVMGASIKASMSGGSGRVSRRCCGKDEDAGLGSCTSHCGTRNKSFYCKAAAVLPHPLARPATRATSGAPLLPLSPLPHPRNDGVFIPFDSIRVEGVPSSMQRDASSRPKRPKPLTSSMALSASVFATAELSPPLCVHVVEDMMPVSPGCLPRASRRDSTVGQNASAGSTHLPSASLLYAQRLRAQQRRQQQYKRQFKTAATEVADHF